MEIRKLAKTVRSREFTPGTEPIRSPYYLANDVNYLLDKLMAIEELDNGTKYVPRNNTKQYGPNEEVPGRVFFIPDKVPTLRENIKDIINYLREIPEHSIADDLEQALEQENFKEGPE